MGKISHKAIEKFISKGGGMRLRLKNISQDRFTGSVLRVILFYRMF
jgi:hypothetical protein